MTTSASTERPLRSGLRDVLRRVGLLPAARAARLGWKALLGVPRNWPYLWSGAPDGLPLPPIRLVQAVSGEADLGWFLQGGALAADSIRSAVAEAGYEFAQVRALLDFGCGCGRVVRHWAAAGIEVHGTDYNPALVGWCRRRLRFGRFEVNGLAPPLLYEDARFDLAYALSVFTHLPEDLQRPWMSELRRVLRQGGLLLVSLHGAAYRGLLDPLELASFDAGRLVVRRDDSPGSNVCGAYHPEAYLRQELAEGFDLLAIVPEGARGNPRQDLVIIRRPR